MFEIILLISLLIIVVSIMITTLKVGISPMPSSKKVSYEILEILKEKEEKNIIDLGSGFGSLAIFLAKNLPEKNVIGYEVSLFPYLISLFLKNILSLKNLEFYRKDFLKEDMKESILVVYLFPKGMEKLEDKLFEEAINTKIISSTFAFRNIKPRSIINTKDIYKTPIYYYCT